MAKEGGFEGHGDSGQKGESVSKGSYVQIGTTAPLKDAPISVNSKSGNLQTGPKQ